MNGYRQNSITTRCWSVKRLITQVTRHLSQIVSSEIMSTSRIKDNNKKVNTLHHLTSSILLTKRDRTKRFLSKLDHFTNQKFQVTIKKIIKKVKSLFSLKDTTLTQHAKFTKERNNLWWDIYWWNHWECWHFMERAWGHT